jgi:hypothetical protein
VIAHWAQDTVETANSWRRGARTRSSCLHQGAPLPSVSPHLPSSDGHAGAGGARNRAISERISLLNRRRPPPAARLRSSWSTTRAATRCAPPTCAGAGYWSSSATPFCPDLCPTALNEIAGALVQLGPLAARIQPVFVSIDPQRDRPEALRDYVRGFDERILPLSGTAEQLARAAASFGVLFHKVPGSGLMIIPSPIALKCR